MQLLYNSDSFTVVQFDVPAEAPASAPAAAGQAPLRRGGYEIVDKFARKEIYLEGALAERFEAGVQELVAGSSSVEDFDEYLSRFTALAHTPLAMH
jgi:hypothetical protein